MEFELKLMHHSIMGEDKTKPGGAHVAGGDVVKQKKVYNRPSIKTQEIKLGVFGDYVVPPNKGEIDPFEYMG